MRSPAALRIVLSLAVLALGLSGTQAQSLRGGGPNVSVGPRSSPMKCAPS